MTKNIVWTTVFILIAGLLESALLEKLTLYNAKPDLALGILVYSAYVNGTMTGQLTGFISGIFIDFLSQAPLGLNALVRTIIGALGGLIRGRFFLGRVLLPMALCASATVLKALMVFILHLLFAGSVPSYALLEKLTLYNAKPDLALGILVYSAYVNGTMTGQLSGFISGIFIDFLSQAPLGLNALVRTIIGALGGLIRGRFFLGRVLLPMALCASATILKALMVFILHLLFAGSVPSYALLEPKFWSELLLNTASAPFLFGLLQLFKPLLVRREH
jgi:rod shape-determining protein MreD